MDPSDASFGTLSGLGPPQIHSGNPYLCSSWPHESSPFPPSSISNLQPASVLAKKEIMEQHVSSTPNPIPGVVVLQSWLSANAQNLLPPWVSSFGEKGNTGVLYANVVVRDKVNQTEEWFYQIKGDMLLKIVENGDSFRDIVIREGEMFLLPGNIPHSPIRYKDTIGLVMERTRPSHVMDRIRWYCPNEEAHQTAPSIIREETFHCAEIETQLRDLINQWMTDEKARKCDGCGQIAPPY
ncbi:3-hydroxyanthranilic acid dioxygenase [Penicillium griseofulvum]|uniref:3-hydroxyanthranilic acid dioxygenase n=1 Tax=Penicillium patulum TaxID=5078 RepID=A0A135LL78_PENPA|nr:3-hydroxyanthranilic acid dioxygenase [Penicillium griseofulvum]KXG49660.1 3-hydroxyanthranilic acid dioxygenase [Penicillium griseofulvum]